MNLSKLDALLDKKLGVEWHTWEIETLSLELGAILDAFTFVKLIVLKRLQEDPTLVLNDADYFLRFVEIANNNVPDPHHHDIPSTLEVIYALKELQRIMATVPGYGPVPRTGCLSNVTRYVMNDEGHGEAYHPLLSEYSGKPLVINDKTKAGDEYIACMDRGDC